MPSLLKRLRQRKLFQWALAYLAGAWLLFQGIEVLAEPWNLSEALQRTIHVLLGVGFVVAVVLAWYHGEKGRQHASGVELLILSGILVLAGAAVGLLMRGRDEAEGPVTDQVEKTPERSEARSVAVLPLANRSGLEEDRYFTDGMHDEILTQLSKISGLSVRGRTSVMQYRDAPKNIRQIGAELNARYLVEGGVQRAGETVRINVQLLDSETDEHVFAETYDRELSLENLLAVQREVALRIADALEATLTAEERAQLARVPTENPEAYDYYLRGLGYLGRPGVRPENYRNAQRMLERAIELDPRFALAYARLSSLHAEAYEYALDRSEERLSQAREAADRALHIDPELPEGHLALGYYHYAIRDHDLALEQLALADRGLPGSPWLLWVRALIQKRQGRWDEATAGLERARALSPREPYLLFELGVTYFSLRRYEEAEAYLDRALALQPDAIEVALVKALVPLMGRGDTGPLRTFLAAIPMDMNAGGGITVLRWFVDYLDRDYAAALQVLSLARHEYFEWAGGVAPKTLLVGACYAGLGETERARAAADSALRDLDARLAERPDDPRLYQALSSAHTLLGEKGEAIRAAQRAVSLMPISRDAVDGPGFVRNLAAIYARFGEVDAAVERFDRYLSVPAPESIESILLDRLVDPVRDHPRFQALLDKYSRQIMPGKGR